MKLINLVSNEAESLNSFISNWSNLYSYTNENLYNKTISKESFTKEDLQNLYIWKNAMKLSVLKQRSLETKIIANLPTINNYKKIENIDIQAFKKEFKKVSSVWKIFLLHVIKPNKYPIYDQHIHRAFLFIQNEDWRNISNISISNNAKEKFYFERYLPFIEAQNIKDLKKLDEAFFTFGQFLNTRNYSRLLS